jgi:hypothetical protein
MDCLSVICSFITWKSLIHTVTFVPCVLPHDPNRCTDSSPKYWKGEQKQKKKIVNRVMGGWQMRWRESESKLLVKCGRHRAAQTYLYTCFFEQRPRETRFVIVFDSPQPVCSSLVAFDLDRGATSSQRPNPHHSHLYTQGSSKTRSCSGGMNESAVEQKLRFSSSLRSR